ncbi:MAG: hypothetical protein H0V29_00885 [Thermoleophilaceae bacterium]|nr:hypothetical protein [Thermoleophilaceae bacterium]
MEGSLRIAKNGGQDAGSSGGVQDVIAGQVHVRVPHERALLRSGHFGMGPEERGVRTHFGVTVG